MIKLNKDIKNDLICIWAGARTRKAYYETMTEEEQKKLDLTVKESFKVLDENNVTFKIQNEIMWYGQNNLDCSFKSTMDALGIEFI